MIKIVDMKYKTAISYGLFSGVVIIGYHIGVHFGNKEWLVSPLFFFSVYLVHLPFMMAAGLTFRKNNNGLVEFKQALREVFITFLVGMLIYFMCYYPLFNIDSELPTLQKVAGYNNILWFKEKGFEFEL